MQAPLEKTKKSTTIHKNNSSVSLSHLTAQVWDGDQL